MDRKKLLYLLLLATLVYRGSFLYEIFSRYTLYSGISWIVRNSRLTVQSLREEDPFRRETLAAKTGLHVGDQVIQFENPSAGTLPVESIVQFSNAICHARDEEGWYVVVRRESEPGGSKEVRLTVNRETETRSGEEWFFTLFWIGLLPLVATITAFFIGFTKTEDNHALLACFLFLSISTLINTSLYLLPEGLREFATIYKTTCTTLMPYLFMRFFLLFPSPSILDLKMPWIKKVFGIITATLWLFNLLLALSILHSFRFYSSLQKSAGPLTVVFNFSLLTMMVIGVISLVMNTLRKQSSDERRRMMILLSGVVAGIIIPAILIFAVLVRQGPSVWVITVIAVALSIFPAAFAYAVVKHRVLGIRLIVRRGLQYLLISRGFWILESILIFFALFFLVRPILQRILPSMHPMAITILISTLTLMTYFLMVRLNQPVMRAIDRRFFRQVYDARLILTELSQAVGRLAGKPAELLHLVTVTISRSLFPERVAVFLKGYDIDRAEGHDTPYMHKMNTEQYFCAWAQHGMKDSEPQLSQYAFPEYAFIPSHVEKLETPEALDVYIEDPRSWAHALLLQNGSEMHMQQEREVLEKLNIRLILPLTAGGQTLGLLALAEKLSEEPYSKEDRKLLLTVAQQAAIALDYSKLISQVAEQERLKREIEIAREVQAQLFPQKFPAIEGLRYTGYCRAARGVGGDYYDFLGLDPHLLGIALGDISGKGISAALLMAQLQALLRSHAPSHAKNLDGMFPVMNRLMCSSTAIGKYATFFYSVYDSEMKTLDYVNAGHLPPMIFRHGGEVLRLRTGGPVMGMLPEAKYKSDQVQMQSGDLLVIYSDGVSEATNPQEEEFGEERLMELIARYKERAPEEITKMVLDELERFVNVAPQNDDITLVVSRLD